jgi:hypothetical protein
MKVEIILGPNNLKIFDVFHANDIADIIKQIDISEHERVYGINKSHYIGYFKKLSTKEDIYQIHSTKEGIYRANVIGRVVEGKVNDAIGLTNMTKLIGDYFTAQMKYFDAMRNSSNVLKNYCLLRNRIKKLE